MNSINKAAKGTPQYEEWLRKYREKRSKKVDPGSILTKQPKITQESVASYINSLKLKDGTTLKIGRLNKNSETPIYANVSYYESPNFIGYLFPDGSIELNQNSLDNLKNQRRTINSIAKELTDKFGFERKEEYSDHPEYGRDLYLSIMLTPKK